MEAELPALLTGPQECPPGVSKLPEFISVPSSPISPVESNGPVLLGSPAWPEEVVGMKSPLPLPSSPGGASPPVARVAQVISLDYSHEGRKATMEALEEAVEAKATREAMDEAVETKAAPERQHEPPCPTRPAVEIPPLAVGKAAVFLEREPLYSARSAAEAPRATMGKAGLDLERERPYTARAEPVGKAGLDLEQERPYTARAEPVGKVGPKFDLEPPFSARTADPEQKISNKANFTPMGVHSGDQAIVCDPADEDVYDKAAEAVAARKVRAREQWQSQDRVRTFLAKHGYAGVAAPRRRLMGSSYPLHCAVRLRDAEMVELLLQFKADPQQENSAGLTPQQYALELNRRGSHDAVMVALSRRAQLAR